jgi:DNA-binding CsgD family transcriptional regulator
MNQGLGKAKEGNQMIFKPSARLSVGNQISEADLYRSLINFSQRNKFEHFIMLKMPTENDNQLSDITLCSNWPTYLFRQFDQFKMLLSFPIFKALHKNKDNVSYDIDILIKHESKIEIRCVLELFKASGIAKGLGLLLEIDRGQQGAILFTSQSRLIDTERNETLRGYSSEIFKDLIALDQYNSVQNVQLSKREHECVSWTSQGKTSYEIGMILGLSENTINNYLVAASRKLGAVNRAHMVGKALRENIIS